MGRDIWVALERRDYDGEWYNCDLFMHRVGALERIPFYTGRSSVLFDFLHTLEKEIPISKVSEGTREILKKEVDSLSSPIKTMFMIEKSTLDEVFVTMGKKIPFNIDDEFLDNSVILPFSTFFDELAEYLRIIFKNEDYCSPSNPSFRIIFNIW